MNLMNQIEYLKLNNLGDMFDDCSVPDGLDMQRVRGAIVMRCGLLTPLYSEPEVQRAATQQFFYENQWNFDHIIKVMQANYSPIENVAEWRNETTINSGVDKLTIARTETETHSGTDGRTIAKTDTENISDSGNSQDIGSEQEQLIAASTTVREISAENASLYQPDNQETENRTETKTGSDSKRNNYSKTISGRDTSDTKDNFTHGHKIDTSGSDTHTSNKDNETTYEVFRHGNVGVTTNQSMMQEELSLIDRFNPYRFIADLYEKELIIGLY